MAEEVEMFVHYKTTRADGSSFEWGSLNGIPMVPIPEDGNWDDLLPPPTLPEGWATELVREDPAQPFDSDDLGFDELYGLTPDGRPLRPYDESLNVDPQAPLTQAAQAFWEAATNEHERKHAERNP